MTDKIHHVLSDLENDTSFSKTILESMGDGVSVIDPEFKIVYQNPAHLEMMGEHNGEFCYKAFEQKDDICDVCPVRNVFSDGKIHTVERVVNQKMGERSVEITASPFKAASGEIIAGIEIVRDITSRKQMEKNLQEIQSRFKMFMAHIPGVAFIKDLDLRMIYANPDFERTNHLLSGEWLGKKNEDLLPPELAADYTKNDRIVLNDGRAGQFTQKSQVNGETKYWSVVKFPLRNLEGKIEYLGGVGVEITEIKNTEKVLHKTMEELWALAAHLQSAREEERGRIAREIHDELGQQLTGVLLSLTSVSQECKSNIGGNKEALHREIQDSISAVENTIHAVRRIATELRPVILDRFGLIAAIEWLSKEFQRKTGISFKVNVPPEDLRLAPERETALFRIIQESLTNIIRHSGATEVNIILNLNDGQLTLEINDNGKGISQEAKPEKHTLGILGMKERAYFLGGSLNITGEPGRGTKVVVLIPLLVDSR
jgi:PAS domain S-box-containing protein